MSNGKTVTVLGINGHFGRFAAEAFVKAGWQVRGMGRSDKRAIPGVEFVKGDAESIADMVAAIGDSEVVVFALNLPYDKWFNGALEAQVARVIAAMGKSGRTLLYPGSIYNYAASLRQVTPDAPERPERLRGVLRMRCEAMFREAAMRGHMQVLIIRAGDFYGPGVSGWFDQGILAQKGRIALPSPASVGHSWAYLPDLGRAFVKVAEMRDQLGSYERFHFAGNFVTSGEMAEAIQRVSPSRLKVGAFPWALLRVIGLFNPLMREIRKMRYLWDNPMRLADDRLDAILGPDFGTPYAEAMAKSVGPLLMR
jgi:nucleoside-diphosphate-sugar epimerase